MYKKALALLLALAFVLTACGGSDVSTPAAEPTPEPKTYTVGETGAGENFAVTLLATATSTRVEDSVFYYTPDAGKEFLLVAVQLENITEDEQKYSANGFSFVADGAEADRVNLTTSVTLGETTYERMETGTAIAAGETGITYVAAHLDAGWKVCEVTFDGVTFAITAEEATPTPTPPPTEHAQGETIETKHFNVTLSQVYTGTTVNESDYFYYEADEGCEFILFIFDIENPGEEERELWSGENFTINVDNGEAEPIILGVGSPSLLVNGSKVASFMPVNAYAGYTLESGAQETGYIAAQAPEGWQTGDIYFDGALITFERG